MCVCACVLLYRCCGNAVGLRTLQDSKCSLSASLSPSGKRAVTGVAGVGPQVGRALHGRRLLQHRDALQTQPCLLQGAACFLLDRLRFLLNGIFL